MRRWRGLGRRRCRRRRRRQLAPVALRPAAPVPGGVCGGARAAACAGGIITAPGIGDAPGGTTGVPAAVGTAERRAANQRRALGPVRLGGDRSGHGRRHACGRRLDLVGLRRLSDQRRRAAEHRVLRGADVDLLQVPLGQRLRANDVRREQHHDVGLRDLLVVGREELLDHRHVDAAGEPGQRLALVVAQQAGQQVRLAVAQAHARRDLARSERGEVLPPDVDVAPLRAAFDLEVQDDVAVVGHARRHGHVDADLFVGERRHRVHGGSARHERHEAGGGHGDFVAQVRRELRPFGSAERRLRDELRLGVRFQELDDRLRQRDVEIGRADAVHERVQVGEPGAAAAAVPADRAGRPARRSAGGRPARGRRVGREAEADLVVGQAEAVLLDSRAVDLEDLDVDHHFRARLVVVLDHALRDRDHRRAAADRDAVGASLVDLHERPRPRRRPSACPRIALSIPRISFGSACDSGIVLMTWSSYFVLLVAWSGITRIVFGFITL